MLLVNCGWLLLGGTRLNVIDGFLDGRNLLGVLVGNLNLKCFLKGHYQLHNVERIGAEVLHKGRGVVHLALIDAQLLHNDLLDLLLNGHDSSWILREPLILAMLRGSGKSRKRRKLGRIPDRAPVSLANNRFPYPDTGPRRPSANPCKSPRAAALPLASELLS